MSDPRARSVVRPIPYVQPEQAFAALSREGMAVLLESAAPGPDTGRYSLVAVDPVRTIQTDWQNGFERLQQLWRTLPVCDASLEWPIGPGLYGSFGYELRRALERLPSRHVEEQGPADLVLGLFDTVAVFDVVDGRAAVIAADLVPGRPEAAARAVDWAQTIGHAPLPSDIGWCETATWTADRSPEDYAAQVGRILEYIRAGDIYQANFTQRWIAPRPKGLTGFDLYRRLRSLSPAPYAAFIDDGHGNAIVSASPERFLKLSRRGLIDTRPIKGTRPRASSLEDDAILAKELKDSTKDASENLMIVDLLRNDLGRVAETGSVSVPELNALYSFASVHHLVSTVTALLRKGLGPVDVIRATFPGGSVTGAPKIRAMEIIDELEAARRGPYCGAIGWIGADRTMELSIAIRTITLTKDRVIAQAGGGIVADSIPDDEYREALTKVRPLLATLDPAFRH